MRADLPPARPALPFTAPALLAPMEGVTDPAFRRVVAALHRPEDLGGVFTEFVRVVAAPLPLRVLSRHLGPVRGSTPIGLQLMGRDPDAVAETARRAEAAGAPVVDLNFGCPAKGALRTCAGSALLRDPAAMEALVRRCVAAVRAVPVTAKIRAGFDDASRVEDLARAVEQGGASMLTVHCRTRAEGYQDLVHWDRIARAVSAVAIPVCGNGGILGHADIGRLRAETGCRFAMVGRAALADPWIFSGEAVPPGRALGFLLDYAAAMVAGGGASELAAANRLKQTLRFFRAGGVVDPERRRAWLVEPSPARLFAAIRAAADGEEAGVRPPSPPAAALGGGGLRRPG